MKMIDYFGNSNRQFGYADDVIAIRRRSAVFLSCSNNAIGGNKVVLRLCSSIAALFSIAMPSTLSHSLFGNCQVFFEEFLMLIDPLLLLWIIGIIHHFADFSTIFAIFWPLLSLCDGNVYTRRA